MKIFYIYDLEISEDQKSSMICELLGLDCYNNYIVNEIIGYIFKQNIEKGEKIFDYNLDYKYYFADFLKYGINLNTQDISWWEFNSILEAVMLDDKSCLSKVIGYRTYKKSNPKNYDKEMERHYNKMKHIYRLDLPVNEEKNYDILSTMWNFVKKKR